MSYTTATTTTTNTATTLRNAFASHAKSSDENDLKTGITWNGDTNYNSLGHDTTSKMLELDQKLVTPKHCIKTATLDAHTIAHFNKLFDNFVASVRTKSDLERAHAFSLLFRYLFYVRSIRAAGKKSRLLFYYLFERIYKIFPKTCVELISLVPDFGYFGDLNKLGEMMSHQSDVVNAIDAVYLTHLDNDCRLIWGVPLHLVKKDMAKSLNDRLKNMTPDEIRTFVGNKRLSLAAKWFKREGKKNSGNRKSFLIGVYFPNGGITDLEASDDDAVKSLAERRFIYIQMLFRNVLSSLTQCLLVGETMMCANKFSSIPIKSAPACFATKYRKALANEQLKEVPTEAQNETGNRYPDVQDRVQCRQNLLQAMLENKLKGATQDIDRLSKIVFEHLNIEYGKKCSLSSSLSPTERGVIAAQWKDLIIKMKNDVDKIVTSSHKDALESGKPWIDPRSVIPVVDTSGSMGYANVQSTAIGLGILATHLSTMPGCFMSFSTDPKIFSLDMEMDVFDHFLTIMNGPSGLSTNIDATYRVLLDLMVSKGVAISESLSLLVLTDGQFDASLVNVPEGSRACNFERATSTFLERMEIAFKNKGYLHLPRTVFWNLNCASPGFPANSISLGIQLISGYSQTLMLQVFTGDYEYKVQTDGSMKMNVTPWDSFLKALNIPEYDKVSSIVASVGEGCLKHLAIVD